ncbi:MULTISPECIES: LPXTG cell wall anchor domain-containing protein [Bacillota]|jgi:LPXTG-motif cell wall-anchored protein|uniref:Oxaloacetate decarboxylase n=1 Tax=Clostridium fessum TaxID=2126740 RepID=A0A2T3FTG6_9CLOT|nr:MULTISPECIES: LPXTG cell wall anchor domain-containing protein [Clostridium]PST38563.1 oxaloacetate decarboxylase [Clostridium fessum]RHQ53872.1 LPXTG cell wall anchor domain-containing protein [Firmicutes bacterium AF25-13AC]RHV94690.1 LPXTG cell wall anchor domain-containing protein [Clostridium sp. OF09-10]SCH47574.1 Uncharacterised protein [uncultured Clostridium sp.]
MKKILVIVAGIVGLIFVIIGAALKINNNAISVIGGVDGPTSVFVATKLNSSSVSMFIVIGVILLVAAIFFYLKRKK